MNQAKAAKAAIASIATISLPLLRGSKSTHPRPALAATTGATRSLSKQNKTKNLVHRGGFEPP